jgi:alkylhydroperoxidase family enzyme
VAGLRREGLSDLEILDIIQSVAFFSWANRLMLFLGQQEEIFQSGSPSL